MRPAARVALFLVWSVLATAGVWGLWMRLASGHHAAGYGNYVPWGLWVAFYIYFIGLSAGAFILSSIIYLARIKPLTPLGPLALLTAVVTLVMALGSIAMDLGHMNRAGQVMLHANLSSMMAWMIFLYSTYFAVILTENVLAAVPRLQGSTSRVARLVRIIPEDFAERWLHRLSVAGIPLAIAFNGGVGALFATVGSRPYWHQPLFPIIFLAGALASGSGCLTLIYYVVWPDRGPRFKAAMDLLGKMVLGLLLLYTLLEWAEFSIPLWQGISHEKEIFDDLMYGPFWWNFWIVHLLLGVVVPVVLLTVFRTRHWAVALGGGLIAVTFISVRLTLVIPPQTQPLVEGLSEAFISPRASFEYFPSLFEWGLSAGVVALGIGLLVAALRLLPILPPTENPQP